MLREISTPAQVAAAFAMSVHAVAGSLKVALYITRIDSMIAIMKSSVCTRIANVCFSKRSVQSILRYDGAALRIATGKTV